MGKIKKKEYLKMAIYGAADTLGGGSNQIIGLYYFVFLTTVAGLPPFIAGIVTGFGRIWDGLIDPLMGVLVDRVQKKSGTVKFFMTIAVIPIILSFFLLWNNTFDFQNDISKAIYFSFAYILWTSSYSLATVPFDSLLPKIVPDYRTRTNYAMSRMIFSGIGGVSATYIYDLFIKPGDSGLSSAFTPQFALMGLFFGIYFAIFVLITARGIKEPQTCYVKNTEKLKVKSIFKSYGNALKSKSYRKFFALVLSGSFISNAILTSMAVFTSLIYDDISNFIATFSFTFLVVNIKGFFEISFFIPNTIMMKKHNKHLPYLIDIPLLIVAAVLILFITPGTSKILYLVAVGLLGAGVSCLGFVPMSLLPDLADVQEVMSGNRNEGVNAGLNTFGKQIVGGAATLVFGLVLQAFNLDSDFLSPSDGNNNAIWAVKIMFAVIPIIMSIIVIIIGFTYKLDEKTHKRIKELITIKREKGSVPISPEDRVLLKNITGINPDSLWISQSDPLT